MRGLEPLEEGGELFNSEGYFENVVHLGYEMEFDSALRRIRNIVQIIFTTRGQYYFRTIKPVAYPGRTPHIHVAVSKNGKRIFTTQMLINGNPANERDGLFRQLRDAAARQSILVDFKPLPKSKNGELTANFNIVLGHTAEELEDGRLKAGIGQRLQNRRG